MNATPFDLILRQSYLHLVSYGLVIAILFVAVLDSCLLWQLKRALGRESARLRREGLRRPGASPGMHPVARAVENLRGPFSSAGAPGLRRSMDLAEAELFVPLRARISLTRDLSTLMGLIATLLALVAAASDFARHGEPQLLIGSVGTGCVATCVAAVGCAISLWNLSRLTRLRLRVAVESEELLRNLDEATEESPTEEVPIRHRAPDRIHILNPQPIEDHAAL
jgi:hypothetical protein